MSDGEKDLPGRRQAPHGRRAPLAAAICIGLGLVLSLVGFGLVRGWEQQHVQSEFDRVADARASLIELEFKGYLRELGAVGRFYDGSKFVDREEFREFVGPVLARRSGIHAFEWIPRVTAEERPAHEQAAREDGIEGYRISESQSRGGLVPAADRPEYFPVAYAEPLEDNRAALGFDCGSVPARRAALEQARDTGQVVATGRIALVGEVSEHVGVLMLHPVYRGPTGTVQERRESLMGSAAVVVHVSETVEEAMSLLEQAAGIDLRVLDRLAPGDWRPLYTHVSRSRPEQTSESAIVKAAEAAEAATLRFAKTFTLGGRQWEVVCTPAPMFLATRHAWGPRACLAVGVSLTALLAAYLLALQGRTRKIAELVNEKTATLKESEERYRTITETAQDAVITADAEDNIWLWNSAAEKIFGFAASEAIGKNMMELIVPPQYHEAKRKGLAGFRRTGHGPAVGKTTELTALRKDGTEFPIEVSISAYQDREGFVAVALVRDITDRKQAEEALQDAHDELETRVEERTKELARSNEELYRAKEAADAANQAKSEFLATMSHEIRTPPHGILSFARFGVDATLTAEPDKLLDYFQKIDVCGKRLMALLSDVLDLAKMESGKMRFEFKPTDIRAVLRSALNDFSSLLADRDITIDYTEPDCEVLLALDQNRLAQVIGNVLSNAGKYTPEGGTIRVDINRSDEGVRVSIRDNGVGIPEEELATIFDKFVQSSKTDSRAGGTGLGLSICREIVEAHQGRIWAENRPEGGAIFHVLLPLMMDTGPGGEQAERSCAEKTDLEDAAQTMTVEAS